MTSLAIVEESPLHLTDYASVPIGFSVESIFDANALTALQQGEPASPTKLTTTYWEVSDSSRGNRPTEWSRYFEFRLWSVFAAFDGSDRVGGAILVEDMSLPILQACSDCALLWDLRVAPEMRGRGIGSALLLAVDNA